MIQIEEAMAILSKVSPLGVEKKPLMEALGHALAEDILADRDLPPADRSAMDGYAVRSIDVSHAPCKLNLIGEVAAGSGVGPIISPGTCVSIMTGGNIPPGADTVVMIEKTTEVGDKIEFMAPAGKGENILRQAEDAHCGETLLEKGTHLGPLQLGVCSAVGHVDVLVYRRPRMAIICTGEELRNTEAAVESHELRNSNGPALRGALATLGYPVLEHVIVRDSLEELVGELTRLSLLADVVLLTGGVSKGKYDFVRKAVEGIGATILFHGVTMRPGKPLLCAILKGVAPIKSAPPPPRFAARKMPLTFAGIPPETIRHPWLFRGIHPIVGIHLFLDYRGRR